MLSQLELHQKELEVKDNADKLVNNCVEKAEEKVNKVDISKWLNLDFFKNDSAPDLPSNLVQLETKYTITNANLNKGSTCIVQLLESKEDGKIVVGKKFITSQKTRQMLEHSIGYEYCLTSMLQHKNIVKVYEMLVDSSYSFYLTMEYFNKGNLSEILYLGYMTTIEVNCLFKQLVEVVHYLHSSGIVHNDIKLENLLIDESGTLKLIDFGCASSLSDKFTNSNKWQIKGSLPYMAPEILNKRGKESSNIDLKALDVWAIGIVLLILNLKQLPFSQATQKDKVYSDFLKNRFVLKYQLRLFDGLPKGAVDLLLRVLDPDLKFRINIIEVYQHFWTKSLESCTNCFCGQVFHNHFMSD